MPPRRSAENPLAPEYTAALIQVLRSRAAWVRGADVLEIGPGVVLAALGALGAASLCGVDTESAAVSASETLPRELGYGAQAKVYHGDMWQSLTGRRFDLIVINLSQYPVAHGCLGGRAESWSAAELAERDRLDPFRRGCPNIWLRWTRRDTHSGFIDLERSRQIIEQSGLELRVALTALVHLSLENFSLMAEGVLRAEEGHSIYCYGPYAFAYMHSVKIGSRESLD